MTIYFDSVIAIYLLDHTGSFQARFLTNDHRLSKCTDITVEVLP